MDGDLFSVDILKGALKDMDYVFHVAGVVKSRTKEGFERGNTLATKRLLTACYDVNPQINTRLKKFVHISSLAACGPNPDENPITEQYNPEPITTYGITKRKAELEVLEYKNLMNVVILRPPAIFGPRDTEILIYFKTYMKGLNSVIGLGKKYLSLIYVKDFVEGIVDAAEKETKSGEIFFISSDRAYNWDEIAQTTSSLLKKKALKLPVPHWFVFIAGFIAQFVSLFGRKPATLNIEKCYDITRKRWVCSNEKAKRILGWKESHSLEEGFSETINWYREMKWL